MVPNKSFNAAKKGFFFSLILDHKDFKRFQNNLSMTQYWFKKKKKKKKKLSMQTFVGSL